MSSFTLNKQRGPNIDEFYSKLISVKKYLQKAINVLTSFDPQGLFPYQVFDTSLFSGMPDDLVLNFFIQGGKLCINVYVITASVHQQSIHSRQKSAVGQALSLNSAHFPLPTTIYFYNGKPVEVLYSYRLEAILPSVVSALNSVEHAYHAMNDLCEKIDTINQLLFVVK